MTGMDSIGTSFGAHVTPMQQLPGQPAPPWLLTMHAGVGGSPMTQMLFVPYSSTTKDPEEKDMSDILTRIGKIEDKVNSMAVDVGAAKERLTHMPTTIDMWKAVIAAAFLVVAVSWTLFTFFGPGVFDTAIERALEARSQVTDGTGK